MHAHENESVCFFSYFILSKLKWGPAPCVVLWEKQKMRGTNIDERTLIRLCRSLSIHAGCWIEKKKPTPTPLSLPCLPPWHRSCFSLVPQRQLLLPLTPLSPFFLSLQPTHNMSDLWLGLKISHKKAHSFHTTLTNFIDRCCDIMKWVC